LVMSKRSRTISAMGRRIGSEPSPWIEQPNAAIASCMLASLATGSPRQRSCLIWRQPGISGATIPPPSLPSRGVGCWPGARNTQGQTKGSGESAKLRLYQLRPDQIYMTGRLGLRLRPNQSIGANRRGGPSSDHPAALQRAARPRKSLCSDITAPVQAVLTKHRRRFGTCGGARQDPVKIGRARQAPVRLQHATFSDGCDYTNRLVRRDIQSVGRMSARLDRVRPLLCGSAFMALRVARRQRARPMGRKR